MSFGNPESYVNIENEVVSTESDPHMNEEFEKKWFTSYDTIFNRNDTIEFKPDAVVKLSGEEFRIIEKISTQHELADGIVYRIQSFQDNAEYALKVYFRYNYSVDEPRPNILKKVKGLDYTTLYHLYDYGTGIKKIRYKYNYEILEFPNGICISDLKELEFARLREVVIPSVVEILKTLFKNDIIYLGTRPENIYFTDATMNGASLLGYANATVVSGDDGYILSSIAKEGGIDFYTVPEIRNKQYSEKSALYCLGMTLLKLLYPDETTAVNIGTLRKKQIQGLPIVEYYPDFYDVNNLIIGLTAWNIEERWGFAEVDKWLNGEEIVAKQTPKRIFPILRLRKKSFESLDSFLDFLQHDKDWYQLLLIDRDEYSKYLRWVGEVFGEEAMLEFDKLVRFYANSSREVIRQSMLRFFIPDLPCKIGEEVFDFWSKEHFEENIKAFFEYLDCIWKSSSIQALQTYLHSFELSLRILAANIDNYLYFKANDTLRKFQAIVLGRDDYKPEHSFAFVFKAVNDINLLKLLYAFLPVRSFRDKEGNYLLLVKDVALFFALNPELYTDKYYRLELDNFLTNNALGHLSGLSLNEFLFAVFNEEKEVLLDIISITPEKNLNYSVEYSLTGSLNTFFSECEIDFRLEESSDSILKYSGKKSLTGSLDDIFNTFIADLAKEHRFSVQKLNTKHKESAYQFFEENFATSSNTKSLLLRVLLPSIIITTIVYFAGNYFLPKYLVLPHTEQAIDWLAAAGVFTLLLGLGSTLFHFLKKLNRGTYVGLGILVLGLALTIFSIVSLFAESNKTSDFRRKYYVENFFASLNTEEPAIITPEKIRNVLETTFFKNDDHYEPHATYELNGDMLSFENNVLILKRTAYENQGLLSFKFDFNVEEYDVVKKGLDNKINGFNFGFLLPGSEKFLKSDYYPMRVMLELEGESKAEFDRVGICFNKYYLMFSKNSVELIDKDIYENPKYYSYSMVLSTVSGAPVNESQMSSSFDVKPNGVANYVQPIKSSQLKTFKNNDNKLKLDINILREKIFIKINNSEKVSFELKEGFWKINHDKFSKKVGLAVEPLTKMKVGTIKINELSEVANQGKIGYRFIPLSVELKGNTPLLSNPNGFEVYRTPRDKNEVAEIYYDQNGYYKVKMIETGKVGYLPQSDSLNIYWEGYKK